MANLINTDTFVQGYAVNECVDRSKKVNEITGNRIVAGSVFIYQKEMNSWVAAFGFHFWTEDKNGNVWDSELMWKQHPYAKVKGTNYRKFHGGKFRWLKEEPTIITNKHQGVVKHLNSIYPKGKGCDMVYVEGYGYNHKCELRETEWLMGLLENKFQMFS